MFLQDNELLTFELPSTFLSGQDILSKKNLEKPKSGRSNSKFIIKHTGRNLWSRVK